MNVKLPEKIRPEVEYLQEHCVFGKNAPKKISKKLAIQIAIQVYAHTLGFEKLEEDNE